jgi:ATP-dependent phosphoenolpyruvate carboxykinase
VKGRREKVKVDNLDEGLLKIQWNFVDFEVKHYKKNWKLQQMDSNSFVELPVILKQN